MYYSNLDHFKSLSGYDIDGLWYPRVTKILEIKSKPALYRFYAEMGNFKNSEAVKNQSASEGTIIHEAVEKIMLGQTPEPNPAIQPAVNAYSAFIEARNIITDSDWVERRIIHYNERYAGTVDALALIDGKFGVLDIKTSQAIYRDYNLQTSAYMSALQREFPNLQTRWILRIDQAKKCRMCGAALREKGGRQKIRYAWKNGGESPESRACLHEWSETQGEIELKEFPYWQEDFKAFLGAKRLWEWENEYWLKQAGYIV